jgi:hypothetical protein
MSTREQRQWALIESLREELRLANFTLVGIFFSQHSSAGAAG